MSSNNKFYNQSQRIILIIINSNLYFILELSLQKQDFLILIHILL